jgi:hypothetical protein
MDHLARPEDRQPPDIRVPIRAPVLQNGMRYDNLDNMTSPERRGFKTYQADEWLRFLVLSDLGHRDWEETLAMVQGWLYFGLLRSILDTESRRRILLA